MDNLRVGIIGCGGRGNSHALGYHICEGVDLVACADVHLPAAHRLAESCGFEAVYADYREMLSNECLDVVSMCLWPELHCQAVLDCLCAPHPPLLINAEKPMAPTYGEAVRMHEACLEAGVKLTFSHQRRFGPQFRRGKLLLEEGAIGELQRMEMDCGNLFDWGTHWFDMMLYYNGDVTPDWVIGQVGCVEDNQIFGARMETEGLCYVKWGNGVTGLLTTGKGTAAPSVIRLLGSKGMIDLGHDGVRLLREGESWENVPGAELSDVRGGDTSRHIMDSIECLRAGTNSMMDSANALRATELIFATYESSRRRSRIVLPLSIEDSPLLAMIDQEKLIIPDWPALLTEQDREDGFKLLFNGRDLGGFGACPESAWFVSTGLLHCRTASAEIRTQEQYADFMLTAEFRLGSRSGGVLAVRDRDGSQAAEIPLLDDKAEPCTVRSTGSLSGVVPAAANPRVGNGRWSWLELTVRSRHIHLVINEVEVLDGELGGDVADSGSICFRLDSGWMDLRDLLVKAL
ncbi:MAG: Gfo/Idh/MocA family oxidoreductase [Lentisphaeria bacterium]|nr:Gfo/Idh/MocA family oxidoreductase [Lentisphaeria bacterium]